MQVPHLPRPEGKNMTVGSADVPPDNPLFEVWTGPFGIAPFETIRPEHFAPAFEGAIAAHQTEIAAIGACPAAPSFANTVLALEQSGQWLVRLSHLFFTLTSAATNEALQTLERELAPILARHQASIFLDRALFARIEHLHRTRGDLGLEAEQARVLFLVHRDFLRAGAQLDGEARERIAAIAVELAVLATRFSQNVQNDESAYELVLDEPADREGLPAWLLEAAARAAEDRGKKGSYIITLARPSVEPFLQFSPRRDLRERAFRAWTRRGENAGPSDNRQVLSAILRLRAERARLLGFATFADLRLIDTMAKTPAKARALIDAVWQPALRQMRQERTALQEESARRGDNVAIEAHDWRYYAQAVKKRVHQIDEAELKPYLQLDNIIAAAFHTASRLFALSFRERFDVPAYHPDVRVWNVTDAKGAHVALFLGDYFARPSKRSGAWMSVLRGQHRLSGDVRPIVLNVMNFSKGRQGGPALLTFDDARTVFHEFGHALHGMLSAVTYPTISGTNVAPDFVEFPSQLFEHWLMQPALLQQFARHAETGEPMPGELIARLFAARNFNQGFATLEYAASAIVDLACHATADVGDPMRLEARVLDEIAMPREIAMRHRLPHFTHIFSGDGYSAGYYAYLWSEVLDADGFKAFEEVGDIFDPTLARRLRDHVYAAGARVEPEAAYRAFRGRDARVDALLEKRGFLDEALDANP
jgi:peptidyl-dipeptidase Dcp